MKFIYTLFSIFLAFVVSVQAADPEFGVLPACAGACISTALKTSTSCVATNTTCLCLDASYNEAVTLCVSKTCTVKEALVTKRLASRQCGVPVKPRSMIMIVTRNTFMALTTLFIAIRIYVKTGKFGSSWWWDDYTIILAYIIAIGYFVDNYFVTKYGLGVDMWDLSFYEITKWLWTFYIIEMLYKFQMSLAKISVVLFFLRIFPSRNFRIWAGVVIGVNAVVGLLFTFLDAFQCMPMKGAWKAWTGEEQFTCIDFPAVALANGIINVVLDVVMLSLPIYEVTKLNLSRRKKFNVCIMFGLGFILTITGIIRAHDFSRHLRSSNPTVDMTPLHYWSLIECDLSVICACLPDTRALLLHHFPKMFTSTTSGSAFMSDSKAFTNGPSRPTKRGDISMTTTYEVQYSARPNAKDEGSFVQLVELDRSTGKDSRDSL